jgi:hypothetical protein
MPWNDVVPAVPGQVIASAYFNEQVGQNVSALRLGGIAVAGQVAGDMLVATGEDQYGVIRAAGPHANLQNGHVRQAALVDYSEPYNAATITTGTLAIDMSLSNVYVVLLNGNVTTFQILNPPPSGYFGSITLFLGGDGTPRTVAWGGIRWPGAVAPPLPSTNGIWSRYIFSTWDNGTNWWGAVAGVNM